MTTLTKSLKEQIVKAVMADVPRIDYDSRIRELACHSALAKAPEAVYQLWAKGPGSVERAWVHTRAVFFEVGGTCSLSVYVPCMNGYYVNGADLSTPALEEAVAACREQNKKRERLENLLNSRLSAVRTFKQFREQLPELVSYLPKEPDPPARHLPAIANLLSELTQMGWPKEGSSARNQLQPKTKKKSKAKAA